MLLPMVGRGISVIKLGEMMMILDLHRQGLSISEIARQTGTDRKTVLSATTANSRGLFRLE